MAEEGGELVAVTALIAAGEVDVAHDRMRAALAWPHARDAEHAIRRGWLAALREVATAHRFTELAGLADSAARDPDNPDGLYELGYALIDAGEPAIAASILWWCLALVGDSEEVVSELVSALESALAYRHAFAILHELSALRARSFLCRYLYAFNAAMTGRLDITREQIPLLVPDGRDTDAMRATLEAIVTRADRVAGACPLDERDLRGWQYVLTGGLLVQLHGGGRFGYVRDTLPRIASSLDRLAPLVRAAGVPCIYAPPGLDHEILARGASERLGIPLAPWPLVGTPAPGLVVAYDLAELPASELPRLAHRRGEQIVFAHGAPWMRDLPLAPEVIGLVYQTLVAPWRDPSRELVADFDMDRTVAAIASSHGLSGTDLTDDDPHGWDALCTRAWPPSAGPRARLWGGGPVPATLPPRS